MHCAVCLCLPVVHQFIHRRHVGDGQSVCHCTARDGAEVTLPRERRLGVGALGHPSRRCVNKTLADILPCVVHHEDAIVVDRFSQGGGGMEEHRAEPHRIGTVDIKPLHLCVQPDRVSHVSTRTRGRSCQYSLKWPRPTAASLGDHTSRRLLRRLIRISAASLCSMARRVRSRQSPLSADPACSTPESRGVACAHLAAVGGVLVTMPQPELVRLAARIQKAFRWVVMGALQHGRLGFRYRVCSHFPCRILVSESEGGRQPH